MSVRKLAQPRYWMIVRAPPGVEIQVLDNDLQWLAAGVERLSVRLPQGLYTVRWQAYDVSRERIVRLAPSAKALEVPYEEPGERQPPRPPPRIDAALERLAARRQALGSEIVVIELSDEGVPAPELSRGLRLFDGRDVAMRSDRGGLIAAQQDLRQDSGRLWATRVYPVKPGLYRLRYVAHSGDTVDQTVTALKNRRTIVVLRKGLAQILVEQPGKAADAFASYEANAFCGVDPRRVTMLSTALRGEVRPGVAALRVARLLLDGLAEAPARLDDTILKRALAGRADPLVRLYAAATALRFIGDPARQPQSSERARAAAARKEVRLWRPTLESLLKPLPSTLPDVWACRWRMADLRAGPRPKGSLAAPPMLAVAWDWVTEGEAAAASAIVDTPSLRGAARGETAAGPWLAWLAAGAKVGLVETDTPAGQAEARLTGAAADQPPALSLPVTVFDDPQKGRFGGQPRVSGFELKASFDDSEDPDWVEIRLWVAADRDAPLEPRDRAVFYLHDTFKPNVYARQFHDRRARLTVHAFGGFTVGVWLPRQGIELELDLAALQDAPAAIKQW